MPRVKIVEVARDPFPIASTDIVVAGLDLTTDQCDLARVSGSPIHLTAVSK
jgi:hypothetical protein